MTDAGFTNVVLCVTEKDIASRSRLAFLRDTVGYMHSRDLTVWTDLWGVGGVFGGEGGSPFSDSGEARHMGNPKLDQLIRRGLYTAASIDSDAIFWDEPEMKDSRRYRNKEVAFLEKYTAAAGEVALKSVVCLCADEAKLYQLPLVANLPDVVEIATDPYVPNPFPHMNITEESRLSYIGQWADFTRQAAESAGIDWHIWVQNFGIPQGRESMIDEHIDILRRRHVGSIAIWGFHGCRVVPEFTNAENAPPDVLWQRAKNALACA
jgi:hypothetical protein